MGLSGDGQDLDRILANKTGIEQFKAHIAHLIGHGETLLQSSHGDRRTVDDPEISKITEEDRLCTGGDIRHIVADMDGLTEDGVAVAIPEIITGIVLQLVQCESGAVVHEPHGMTAVFRLYGEEQVDAIIVGDRICRDPCFGSFSFVEKAEGLVRSVTIDEGPVLRTSEGFIHALEDVLAEIEVCVKRKFRAQLHQTVDLVRSNWETGEIVLSIETGDGGTLRHELGIIARILGPDHITAGMLF